MKKFVVVYHASADAMEEMKKATPKDMEKGQKEWMDWTKKIGKGLVDIGSPLGNGQTLGMKGSSKSNSTIIGYSVLQAENMQKAKDMLKKHPHYGWDESCKLELFESMPMGG